MSWKVKRESQHANGGARVHAGGAQVSASTTKRSTRSKSAK